MKNKKYLIAAAIVAVTVMCSACGSTNNNNGNTQGATPPQTMADNTTQATTTDNVANDVTCKEIDAAVAQALGDGYWLDTEMPGLEDLGITEDMYSDFVYKVPLMSVNVDTLIIVKANEGKLDEVVKALENYQSMLRSDAMQYPSNLAKIANSVIKTYGNYAAFIQLGADKAENAVIEATEKNNNMSEDEVAALEKEKIDEQNQLADEAIRAAVLR